MKTIFYILMLVAGVFGLALLLDRRKLLQAGIPKEWYGCTVLGVNPTTHKYDLDCHGKPYNGPI